MKKVLIGIFTGIGLFLIISNAQATLINLDATDPYNGETLLLDAGSYKVEAVGVAGGGLYDAWIPWDSTHFLFNPVPVTEEKKLRDDGYHGWINYYSYEIDTTLNHISDPYVYRTPLLALQNAIETQFTLTSTKNVKFYLGDDNWNDNAGGMSLRITQVNAPVPEPATILLFGTGLAGLTAVGRRRKK